MRRRLYGLAALVLVAGGCGGDEASTADDPDPVAGEPLVIASPDGRATLTLQPGSLPDGVSASDVTVEAIAPDSPDPADPIVAVRLSPDGVVLSKQGSLAVELPQHVDGGLIVIHMSGDSFDFVTGDIEVDDDKISMTSAVGHFSHYHFYSGLFEVTGARSPNPIVEDDTQQAQFELAAKPGNLVVNLNFDRDDSDEYRRAEFSAAQPPIVFTDGSIRWTRFEGAWNPIRREVEFVKTSSGWRTTEATSTCLDRNDAGVALAASASFPVTLVSLGSPITWRTDAMARFFVTEDEESFVAEAGSSRGDVQLLDVAIGATIQAATMITDFVLGRCVIAGATSSTTTTTTTTTTVPSTDDSIPSPVDEEARKELTPTNVENDGETATVDFSGSGAKDLSGTVDSFELQLNADDGDKRLSVSVVRGADGELTAVSLAVECDPPDDDGGVSCRGGPSLEGTAAWTSNSTITIETGCPKDGDATCAALSAAPAFEVVAVVETPGFYSQLFCDLCDL